MNHSTTPPTPRTSRPASRASLPRPDALVGPALIALLAIAACSGSEGASDSAAAGGDAAPPAAASASRGESPAAAAEPTGRSAAPSIPVVRFAAHGPSPRTYGPRCGDGIEGTGSDVFRLTVPEGWTFRGTGGGTGADDISFAAGGTRVTVDLYATREEMRIEDDFEDRGATGLTVELPGASVPLHEVAVEGRTGYGILYLPWLVNMPTMESMPPKPDTEGSILITAPEPGVVSAEEAAAVLSTVRVERCSGISRLLVHGPAAGIMPVPDFEGGDPLGKARPDEPQPDYVPGRSPLLAYSEAQVAYLLPLEAETARCVAPLVREDAGGDPILHLKVLTPSGTTKEVLAGYAARCG